MKVLKSRDKLDYHIRGLSDPKRDRLIMLDYDGTLAPFVVDRLKAYPYKGIPELLDAIIDSPKNRVVIVSGREAEEVRYLLGIEHKVEIFGAHGSERIMPDGSLKKDALPKEAEECFSEFEKWAAQKHLLPHLEHKHGSVAFHVRGLDDERAETLLHEAEEEMKHIVRGPLLEYKNFDGGIEIRVVGEDKGKVVGTLLNEVSEETLCFYFGDDLTDEDAFKALGDRGLSLLVRETFRPTNADVWIVPPHELKEWLTRFIITHE